jgi:trimethylamine---corrinoid protein Co-methyltransferase
VDLIDSVGPGGNYFTEGHTLANYRAETWYPDILERGSFETWTAAGSTTLRERARAKLDRILAEHAPPSLDPAVGGELDRIQSEG